MVATVNPLRVRWPEFDAVTLLRGWKTDAERARQLGISQSTLTNLRAGRAQPGRKFIDGIINALGPEAYAKVIGRGPEFDDVSFPGTCEACDEETTVAMARSTDPRDEVRVTNLCADCGRLASVRWVDER